MNNEFLTRMQNLLKDDYEAFIASLKQEEVKGFYLNPLKKDIIAVRGNCDSEVDQMVLDFPMRSDYALMDVDQHHFFMTHGHLFNEDQLPLLNENDILIYGHFHKPLAKKENGIYILNPSSISLPKEGTNSYGIYENDCFTIKTFDDEIVKQIQLD